jgi:cyclic pyranopterin phosphate synthase
MLDDCHREITDLRLSVTDRCNYRCRYCMPPEGVEKRAHAEICSYEELLEMAQSAVRCGIRKIRLTGGEPLARRNLPDFCRMLKTIPGLRELCLTTNGSLLPDAADELRAAGVDRLNISLDTLNPEKFAYITRLGRLEDVMRGLRAAEEAGFQKLKINCVLIGGFNDGEIGDFVGLTQEHPWEVRFIELMPMGPCAGWKPAAFLSGDTVLQRCPRLAFCGTDGVARLYQLPGAAGRVGLISPMSHAFCASCSRIRLTADGNLKPCLHSGLEIPLRGLHGEALDRAFAEAAARKPAGHALGQRGSETNRCMNEIGG